MQYLSEYRQPDSIARMIARIKESSSKKRTLMEICGGQTHSIMKHGIDQALDPVLNIVHGPGCPVCVTPVGKIDLAIALARQPEVILCSFGDMLRVPGSASSLIECRAGGGDVRVIYSPLDCLKYAEQNPDRQIVFFGIGFETTAAANALLAAEAKKRRLRNLSMLVSQVRVPPAMELILQNPGRQIEGFLAAGHVCAIMGTQDYRVLAQRYGIPIVICGFEPLDILIAIHTCLDLLKNDQAQVVNQYRRSVATLGNQHAQSLMKDVFTVVDMEWRGLGLIPKSGLGLAPSYQEFDAEHRWRPVSEGHPDEGHCLSAAILQGQLKPTACPHFGTTCRPEHPKGAPMVSTEGACAAYMRYHSDQREVPDDA